MTRLRGPFRIDRIYKTDHRILISVKAVLDGYSGYTTLRTDDQGGGIFCDQLETQLLTTDQFQALKSETIPEIAARFSRAMLTGGLGPMYDMDNKVCAVTPDEVAGIEFYPLGCVGTYR